MAAVSTFVVDEADIDAVQEDGDTASTRLTFQVEHLEQRVIRYAPGRSRERTPEGRHDLLYVLSGRGALDLDGARHALDPGTAVFVAPGETYGLENPGPGVVIVVGGSTAGERGGLCVRRVARHVFEDDASSGGERATEMS